MKDCYHRQRINFLNSISASQPFKKPGFPQADLHERKTTFYSGKERSQKNHANKELALQFAAWRQVSHQAAEAWYHENMRGNVSVEGPTLNPSPIKSSVNKALS